MQITKYFIEKDETITSEHRTFYDAILHIRETCTSEAWEEIKNWDCIKQKVDESKYDNCTFDMGFIDGAEVVVKRITLDVYNSVPIVEEIEFKDIDHYGYIIGTNWLHFEYSRIENKIYFIQNGMQYCVDMGGIENAEIVFKAKVQQCNSKMRRKMVSFNIDYKFKEYIENTSSRESAVFTNNRGGKLVIHCDGFLNYFIEGNLGYKLYTKLEEFVWKNVH